jgi:DNA processing protein
VTEASSPEWDWLALNLVSGLGPKTLKALLAEFGSASAVLGASPSALHQAGVSEKVAARLPKAREAQSFKMEQRLLRESGEVRLLCPESAEYPSRLQEIATPPPVLYWWGSLLQMEAPCLAFVGSRQCSSYGKQHTRRLIAELAEHVPEAIVVSGLARGVDTVAHEAALEFGLKTVAVLAGGLTHLYPPENASLAQSIREHGALISEFPMALRPVARNFPIRNRVISGLSQAVIVTEAKSRSGALITAAFALQQNREVFALPGRVDSPSSEGAHHLIIRQQARLLRSMDDVLYELPNLREGVQQGSLWRSPSAPTLRLSSLPEAHATVLRLLHAGVEEVDQLHVESGISMGDLLSLLTELELMGHVQQQGGQRFQLEAILELESK